MSFIPNISLVFLLMIYDGPWRWLFREVDKGRKIDWIVDVGTTRWFAAFVKVCVGWDAEEKG